MKVKQLSRRSFLRGTSGLMLHLPVLEIMLSSNGAYAAGERSKHFGMFFIGQSLGGDEDPRNYTIPIATGPNYASTIGLKALFDQNLNNDISVVSNLQIPIGTGPGARSTFLHPDNSNNLIAGHMPTINGSHRDRLSVGADQIIASQLAAGRLYPSLHFCGQMDTYRSGNLHQIISHRKAAGQLQGVVPQISPQAAFNALFSNLQTGGQDNAAFTKRQLLRKSILDQILTSRDRFFKKIGQNDRLRVEQHFDEIRDLERRVNTAPVAETVICKKPKDPGVDPKKNPNFDYTSELEVNEIFMDIIHMAYACNITSVVTHAFSAIMCFMSPRVLNPLLNSWPYSIHELGHTGEIVPPPPAGVPFVSVVPDAEGSNEHSPSYAMSLMHQWQIRSFATLLTKMKNTPEGAGNMLDNAAIALFFEGGHSGNTDDKPADKAGSHTTDNMMMLVAGRGGGLKPKGHIKTNKAHPAKVTLAAMKAMGYTQNKLGETVGELTELFD